MRIRLQVGQFAMVPKWLVDLNPSANALRVYIQLALFGDKETGESYRSREHVREACRLGSLDTLDRALKELLSLNAISVETRKGTDGKQTSNLYTVHQVDPTEPHRAAPMRPGPELDRAAKPSRTHAALSRSIDPEEDDPETAAAAPLWNGLDQQRKEEIEACRLALPTQQHWDPAILEGLTLIAIDYTGDQIREARYAILREGKRPFPGTLRHHLAAKNPATLTTSGEQPKLLVPAIIHDQKAAMNR